MKRIETIVADIKNCSYDEIKLKQLDTTRLIFKVLKDEQLLNINGCTASAIFTKPNNKIIIQDATVDDSNNTITVDLKDQCLSRYGKARIEIEIRKDSEVLSTFQQYLKIEESGKGKAEAQPDDIEFIENIEKEMKKMQDNWKEASVEYKKLTETVEGFKGEQETQDTQILALQKEKEALQDIVDSVLPYESNEGENLTLKNTTGSRFRKIEVKGNDYQKKTTATINIFDKNDLHFISATVNKTQMKFDSGDSTNRTYYIKCKPNTKYKYRKELGSFLRFGTCEEVPVANGVITKVNDNTDLIEDTLISGSNDQYFFFYPLKTSEIEEIGFNTVIDSISIYSQCKNLMDLSKIDQGEKNGVTCTYDEENQTITLNGTCTKDNTNFKIPNDGLIPTKGKTTLSAYYVSGTCETESTCCIRTWNAAFSTGISVQFRYVNQEAPQHKSTYSSEKTDPLTNWSVFIHERYCF